MSLPRRKFLNSAMTSVLAVTAFPAAIAGNGPARHGNGERFPQGVASADPQPDSITLWTRVEPDSNTTGAATLRAQVSQSADFSLLLVNQTVEAFSDDDYTLRLCVDGLQPDSRYFYRFVTLQGDVSRIGRTRTAPEPNADRSVVIGFASCQNYEQGYFGAWSRMITEDKQQSENEQIDFVLHLGDFIYERYRGTSAGGERFARKLPEFPDGQRDGDLQYALSLADYRHLYKVYLSDPDLQAARARWPFICTWDDHEFSNDNYQGSSTYNGQITGHQQRKLNANRAWSEYVPACLDQESSTTTNQHSHEFRPQTGVENSTLGVLREDGLHSDPSTEKAVASLCIYRSLQWGRHVDLLITDLRSYRSPPAVPYGLIEKLGLEVEPAELVDICDGGREYNNGKPPDTLPFGDGQIPNPAYGRPAGSMLGKRQRGWFQEKLAASKATWRVWGNGIPCMTLRLDLNTLPFMAMQDSILIQDAWAGYPSERRKILEFVNDTGRSNLVSLSGDHHMHAAALLYPDAYQQPATKPAGMDFATSGISSTPHWESALHRTGSSSSSSRLLCGATVDGELKNTWNMSLLHGVLATMAYAQTGMMKIAHWLGPNKSNKGLKYIDTHSNGYGVARFSGTQLGVQLVTVTDTTKAHGPGGPDVLRRADFRVPRVAPDQDPVIEGPTLSGMAPFPYSEF